MIKYRVIKQIIKQTKGMTYMLSKNNIKKIFAIVFALVLCISVASCGGKTSGGENTDTEGVSIPETDPADTVVFSEFIDDIASYKLVRGDTASDAQKTAAVTLRKALADVIGENPELVTDMVGASELEILVGSTKRAESSAAAEGLDYYDYAIKQSGKKIVIAAGSDEALATAVDYFIENYIDAEVGKVRSPGADGYVYAKEVMFDDLTVGGVSIKDFRLCNKSVLTTEEVEAFTTRLFDEVIGVKLTSVSSDTDVLGSGNYLVLDGSSTSTDECSITVENGNLVLRGNHDTLSKAIEEFFDSYLGGIGEKQYDLTSASDMTIKYDGEIHKTYVGVGPFKRDDIDKAQHPQGMATDGEYIYISFTGLIVKVRIDDGEVVGRFVPSSGLSNLGFHMGDITYKDGYIYGGLTGWGTEKSYVGIISVEDLEGSVSDEVLYAAYLPEGGGVSGKGGAEAEYSLSDGTTKYAIGGVDGIDYGKLPGGGWIDAEGNVHEDDAEYLFVAFSGGVPTSSDATDDDFDNDNYMIGAYSFEDLKGSAEPLTADRFKTEGAEQSKLVSRYRMFVYTGACRYGAQTLAVDRDTGDIIMNMYGRPIESVYPANSAVVIDGSKMLYTAEIEVGQSSSSAHGVERAELYMMNGEYPTELFMTIKCTCGKGDLEAHEEKSYGDTDYNFRFCSTLGSWSNGCVSLGNGYYYTLSAWGSDSDGWNAGVTLYKLSRNGGAWSYVKQILE